MVEGVLWRNECLTSQELTTISFACIFSSSNFLQFQLNGHHIHCDHKIKLSHIKWRKNVLNTTCALTLEHP